ncbi:hypothetical protein VKT23_002847 [Stygiomarasmius scandens]|uniref:DUF6534 domain-containing protein n=1 Tax=Marasmiellus scandens TaxID=2682957 RepID=A0ABR1JZU0_9AGAR
MASPDALPSFQPDLTIGPLEIGVLVATCLFGVTCTQTYMYFNSFRQDQWNMKLVVWIVWLLDLGHTVSVCHFIYTLTITDYGQGAASLVVPPVSIDIALLLSALIGPLEQAWFTRRLYTFSKNIYLTGICALLSLARLVGSIGLSVVALHQIKLIDYILHFGWLLTSIIAVIVANDFLLAVFLAYCLNNHKSRTYKEMSRVLDKLIIVVIETGAITSIGAIACLVFFLTMPFNTIWLAFFILLAKLYTNAFLASLNARKKFGKLFGQALPLRGIDRPSRSSHSAYRTSGSGSHWRSQRLFSISQIIMPSTVTSNPSRYTDFEMTSPLEATLKTSNHGPDQV